jgi:hypothetical protein
MTAPRRLLRLRRLRPVLAGAAAVALLAGCSIPSDSSAQRIDASLLPQLGPTANNCADLTGTVSAKVPLFFVTGQEETRILAPLERDVDRPVTAQNVLQRLFDCPPTTAEQDSGFTTQIPVTTLEGFVEIEPGRYEVHLSPLRSREGGEVDELSRLAVAQIVYTVTNPDLPEPVWGVRFVIDGEPKASNTDGATKAADEFVTRNDFTVTQPTTTTTVTTTTSAPVQTTVAPGPDETEG